MFLVLALFLSSSCKIEKVPIGVSCYQNGKIGYGACDNQFQQCLNRNSEYCDDNCCQQKYEDCRENAESRFMKCCKKYGCSAT